jgi:hypothetical protein
MPSVVVLMRSVHQTARNCSYRRDLIRLAHQTTREHPLRCDLTRPAHQTTREHPPRCDLARLAHQPPSGCIVIARYGGSVEADELRLLPARQVLGFGVIGALTLVLASVAAGMPTAIPFAAIAVAMLVLASAIAPGRRRAFIAASVASAAAAVTWLLVPLVAPPGDNTAITLIALAAAAASAWSADFLYHEWRPRPPTMGEDGTGGSAPKAEIVDLDPAVDVRDAPR